MGHLIDSYTGTISLEKGLLLTPGMTPDSLMELIGSMPSGSFGNRCWYSDIRMETDHGELIMNLYFKKDALVMWQASLTSAYGTTGSMIKTRNDKLLMEDLGRPSEERQYSPGLIGGFFLKRHAQPWHETAREFTWRLPFGTVVSTVDTHDGASVFRVRWK